MKNVFKRIAAMGAAVMMTASIMSMSAGAAVTPKNFELHNSPGAPSSANATKVSLDFTTTQTGKYTVSTTVTSQQDNTTVRTNGYVFIGDEWKLVSFVNNTATRTGSNTNIIIGLKSKNEVSINTSTSSYTAGYGYTAGF